MTKKVKDGNFKAVSIALLAGTALVFAVWDFVPFVSRAIGDTLSELIQVGMFKFPAVPLAWGILNGHWIFRNDSMEMNNALTFGAIGFVLVALGISILVQHVRPFQMPTWAVLTLFSTGFVAGHYIWPLNALKG